MHESMALAAADIGRALTESTSTDSQIVGRNRFRTMPRSFPDCPDLKSLVLSGSRIATPAPNSTISIACTLESTVRTEAN